ncbi:MAG: phospholipase D-like domain-containing protein [Candidatus Heimdallarchaeaceae archaeon]
MSKKELKYYGSWKGRVIKAIVIDGVYTWKEIRDSTGLSPDKLNVVLKELFDAGALKKIQKEEIQEYRVDSVLYKQYKEYFEKLHDNEKIAPKVKISEEVQKELAKWIDNWKDTKRLSFSLKRKHFYLEGRFLDDFSKDVIANAKAEVLVAAPWIKQCHLSETLIDAKQNGALVTIVMRTPDDQDKKKYQEKLRDYGIKIYNNDKIHAKIITVDRALAIVSSMNFIVQSSGGQSWEAGMVTLDNTVVEEVVNSILKQIERRGSIKT